jgi:hypothetical protein
MKKQLLTFAVLVASLGTASLAFAQQTTPPAMPPQATEFYTPVPPKVTPGAMNNQAASMRKQMTAGQAYVAFTQLINNSRSIQELEQYKKEIIDFDNNKFDQPDKTNLFKLIVDKSKLLNADSNQENNAQNTEYTELVNTEPLTGLETLKTEIENNQYLNQNQKINLIKTIDQRIMNRR